MRLELNQIKKTNEEHIDIYYHEMSPEIKQVIALLEQSKHLTVKNHKGEQVVIKIESVLYFETVDKKLFAYQEKDVYQVMMSLSHVEATLSSIGFTRISKSHVVNVYAIESIKPEINMRVRAILSNGEYILINRGYKKAFEAYLKECKNLI